MANRILRDWTNSEKVNDISLQAEVFFTRLIMKADDFGSFYGNIKILKANLFPLKIDTVRDADITRWIAECEKAGLLLVYTNAGKRYLRINDFGQRLRSMCSRFPAPDSNSPSNDRSSPPEVETEVEEETKEKQKGFAAPALEDVIVFMNEKIDEFSAMGEAQKFINHYSSNGWMVGKNKMKNWRGAAAGWLTRMNDFKKSENGKQGTSEARITALKNF